jgi:hypothetical protein
MFMVSGWHVMSYPLVSFPLKAIACQTRSWFCWEEEQSFLITWALRSLNYCTTVGTQALANSLAGVRSLKSYMQNWPIIMRLMRGIFGKTGEQRDRLCWCADFSSWRRGLWRHVWSLRWWWRASRLLRWWRENHMSTFTWKNKVKKVGHASILHSWWQAAALLFSMFSCCM